MGTQRATLLKLIYSFKAYLFTLNAVVEGSSIFHNTSQQVVEMLYLSISGHLHHESHIFNALSCMFFFTVHMLILF